MVAQPIGLKAICGARCDGTSSSFGIKKLVLYRVSVLILTYFSYTLLHLTRKPISVVKSALNRNCSIPEANNPNDSYASSNFTDIYWCDWAPFDDEDGSSLLGTLDSIYLFAYAIGMFVSGPIGDRMNIRHFLTIGHIASGVFTAAFGLAYTFNIHNIWFFAVIQAISGFVQSIGWPCVVTAVGNWFGKRRNGVVFGIWNTNTNVGNILGTLIAASYVMTNWSFSFYVPGLLCIGYGIVVFLFLSVDPEEIHTEIIEEKKVQEIDRESQLAHDPRCRRVSCISLNCREFGEPKAIGFIRALLIPGVIEYSLSLFFSKLVTYTFLFWLPKYISVSTLLDPEQSAELSTMFDVGGLLGAILAGVLKDTTGMGATTCTAMLILALPFMFLYQSYGSACLTYGVVLLLFGGMFVNGPYALITTTISTELGTHKCLKGNAKAISTVSSIIDGTGSIGAAIGPLLAGWISIYGWKNVFYMLMLANVCAVIFLVRLVYHEISDMSCFRRNKDEDDSSFTSE